MKDFPSLFHTDNDDASVGKLIVAAVVEVSSRSEQQRKLHSSTVLRQMWLESNWHASPSTVILPHASTVRGRPDEEWPIVAEEH